MINNFVTAYRMYRQQNNRVKKANDKLAKIRQHLVNMYPDMPSGTLDKAVRQIYDSSNSEL